MTDSRSHRGGAPLPGTSRLFPFELQIAARYLMLRQRGMFISVISAISALGVVLGVAILKDRKSTRLNSSHSQI